MLRNLSRRFLNQWHKLLNLPRQSPPSWYQERLQEEQEECKAATTTLEKLSETSDVFFTISRARYDGHPVGDLPPFHPRHVPVYGYMLAKFTSRWLFYRVLAFLCGSPTGHWRNVREVVNPSKDHKLEQVASRHHIDQDKFKRIGGRLRRVWLLFP